MIRVNYKKITFKRACGNRVTKEYLLELGGLPNGIIILEEMADFIMKNIKEHHWGYKELGESIKTIDVINYNKKLWAQ